MINILDNALRDSRIKLTNYIKLGLILTPFFVGAVSAQVLPPKIEIPADTFDFGSIAEGHKVIHDFEVKNAGGSDLVIQQVVPACGCTAAVAKESTVPAGGSTVIHVEFDSSGFSGAKSKAARVNSNDPVNPSLFVTLKGTIETGVSFEPERVQFGEFVNATDVPVPEVRVAARTSGDGKIVSVVAGSPALAIVPVTQNQNENVFSVRPVAGALLGDIRDRVIVTISKDGQNREVSLPVLGKAVGPVSLKPSSVAMGIIEGASIVERRVHLENRRKKPVSITSIDTDNPAVSVTQKVIQEGKTLVLVVAVNPKLLSTDLRSTVTLNFDDPTLTPLQFSVYGVRPAEAD
jgi:hypothetical protein